MANAPSFSSLPVEIHLEIIDRLEGPARVALAYTSHYFEQIVTRQVPPPTNAEKLRYLCEAETWPVYHGYFACNQCLKMRPSIAFSAKQLQGKRMRGYSENGRRFCLSCGIRKHIYQVGHVIPIDEHSRFVVCWCTKFRGTGSYSLLFGGCTRCGESMPVIHFLFGYGYQPCLDYSSCVFCGYKGRLSSLGRPLRGQLDEIIHQYRNNVELGFNGAVD